MTEPMALDAKALEAAMAAHRDAVVTMDACQSCMGNGFVVTGGAQEPCAWCGGAAEVAPNAEREMMASAIAAYLQTLPTIVRWEHRLWYDDTSSWSTWRDGKNPKIVDNRFEERPLFALPPPAAGEGLEPVAWRWRWGKMGSNTAWHLSIDKPDSFAEDGYEVRGLVDTSTPAARAAVLEPSNAIGVRPETVIAAVAAHFDGAARTLQDDIFAQTVTRSEIARTVAREIRSSAGAIVAAFKEKT